LVIVNRHWLFSISNKQQRKTAPTGKGAII
jgi:hypothetical protein